VYRSTSSTGTFSSIGTTSSIIFSDSSLSPSTTYYYYVMAGNSAGTSVASSTVSATTAATPPPAAPTSLSATTASSTGINLTWTASTGPQRTRCTAPPLQPEPSLPSEHQAAPAYADSGLTASTTYYYDVTAGTPRALGGVFHSFGDHRSRLGVYRHLPNDGSARLDEQLGHFVMTLVGNDTWQVLVTLTPNTTYAYKYDAFGDWSNASSWGASGTNGVAALSPVASGNIKFHLRCCHRL